MNTVVHLESRINQIYDHLYANAPVRVPTAIALEFLEGEKINTIAKEVGKILRAMVYLEQTDKKGLSIFGLLNNSRFEKNDRVIIEQVATLIREAFKKTNTTSKYYKSESVINLADSDIAFTCGK